MNEFKDELYDELGKVWRECVTPEKLRKVLDVMIRRAEEGDVDAARLLLEFSIPFGEDQS